MVLSATALFAMAAATGISPSSNYFYRVVFMKIRDYSSFDDSESFEPMVKRRNVSAEDRIGGVNSRNRRRRRKGDASLGAVDASLFDGGNLLVK